VDFCYRYEKLINSFTFFYKHDIGTKYAYKMMKTGPNDREMVVWAFVSNFLFFLFTNTFSV
jgi:hypothetical protein